MKKIIITSVLVVCVAINCYSIILPDGNKITASKIETYVSGKLKKVDFSGSVNIKTSVGDISFIKELEYYENGNLLGGYIEDVIQIPTKYGNIEADTLLRFFESGALNTCYIQKQDQIIQTKIGGILASERIHFNENGTINSLQSYYFDTTINNNDLKFWLLQFDDNENLVYGRIEKGTIRDSFDNMLEPSEIYIKNNGKELYLPSVKPIVVQVNQLFVSITSTYISENFIAYLPQNKIKLNDITFGDNVFFLLDNNGKLVGKGIIDKKNSITVTFF